MSRTYKYPRESLDDSITRKEKDAHLRIQRKLEWQKQYKKRKVKANRAFKKYISFRDRSRSRV